VILVDTSVWIEHLREGVADLVEALGRGEVVMHPFVVGELACGNLSDREDTIELLQQLRSVAVADHAEVMAFIEAQRLYGCGIGYIDVHLLASSAIDGAKLWTNDRRLRELAATLDLVAPLGRRRNPL